MADLNIKSGGAATGYTLTDELRSRVAAATKGGPGTTAYFTDQYYNYKLAEVASNLDNWSILPAKPEGNPTYYPDDVYGVASCSFQYHDQNGKTRSRMLRLLLKIPPPVVDVLLGRASSDTLGAPGDYVKIIEVSGDITDGDGHNIDDKWAVRFTELVAKVSEIAGTAALLAKAGAKALNYLFPTFLPTVRRIVSGIGKTCYELVFGAAETAATAAEAGAAAATGTDAIVIEGAEVATTAISVSTVFLIGAAVLLVATVLVKLFLLHASYHRLSLLNMTPFPVNWYVVDQAHGEMKSCAVDADGRQDHVVEAVSVIKSDYCGEVTVVTEAPFRFQSRNEFEGVRYVLELRVNEGGAGELRDVGCMFDVPWGAWNSLYCSARPAGQDWGDFSNKWAGENKVLTFSGSFPTSLRDPDGNAGSIKVSQSFDYLEGQHPVPEQGDQYAYCSTLTVEWLPRSSAA